MDHETTKLRARIGALEAELDAVRAEYVYYGAWCEADAIELTDVLRKMQTERDMARAQLDASRAIYAEATSALAVLVEERDAFRAEVKRLQTLACDAYARGQADNETSALEGIAYASDAIGKAIEELFARAVADLRVEFERITTHVNQRKEVTPWQVSVEGSGST